LKYIIQRFLLFILLEAFVFSLLLFVSANSDLAALILSRIDDNINADLVTGKGKLIHTDLRFSDIENYRDVDILIVGSSVSYTSFDTRVFERYGYKTFNMATAAQTPINSYYLLRMYINHLNPKLIVMECFWNQFAMPVESTIDLIGNAPMSKDIMEMTFAASHISTINALIVRWLCFKDRQEIKITPGQIVKFTDHSTKKFCYISGGSTLFKGHWEPREIKMQHKDIFKPGLKYLERTINLARSKGITVILVSPPITKEMLESVANYDEIISSIEEFAFRNEVTYINFHETGIDSREGFMDQLHLNIEGAELFTEKFIHNLQEQ